MFPTTMYGSPLPPWTILFGRLTPTNECQTQCIEMYERCRALPTSVKQGDIIQMKELVATVRHRLHQMSSETSVSAYESILVERVIDVCLTVTQVATCVLKQRHRQKLKRNKAQRQATRAIEDKALWTQCGISF